MSDPFTTTENTITPLQVDSTNEYSVKYKYKSLYSPEQQIITYAGSFVENEIFRIYTLESAIAAGLESLIQQTIAGDFQFVRYPTFARPPNYTPQVNDLIMSFDNRNEFFVFRDIFSSPLVLFFAKGFAVDIQDPLTNPTFSNTASGLTYSLDTYIETGSTNVEISISDEFTRVFYYNGVLTSNGQTASYDSVSLGTGDTGINSEILYRNYLPNVPAGITILPSSFVGIQNLNHLQFAEQVTPFFYDPISGGPSIIYTKIVDDYLFYGNTFTASQDKSVECISLAISLPIVKILKFIENYPNTSAGSSDHGNGIFVPIGKNISLEIRISG